MTTNLKIVFAITGAFVSLTALATAQPYVFYTGTGSATSLTLGSTATTLTSELFYLVVDQNDTANYAVLQVNASTKTGTITGYPITGATTGQSNANFFGGLVAEGNRSGGLSVFTSGSQVADVAGNTVVTRFYGTGDLNSRPLTIVPARTGNLIVHPRVNGVAGAPVTFGPSAVINAATATYPLAVRGIQFGYTIAADGTLTNATTAGNFLYQEAGVYTILANIGGTYTIGKNIYAVQPVVITTTETDALTTFLSTIAADNGYTVTVQ